MTKNAEHTIRLRIIYDGAGPPGWSGSAKDFGLQDKDGALRPPRKLAKDRLAFDLELSVKGERGKGAPVFLGTFAHGSPHERLLYLSWRHPSGAGWTWRFKLPLSSITWQDVAAAQKSGRPLVGDAAGRKPGGGRSPVEWRLAAR